jgi:hypothetical protein
MSDFTKCLMLSVVCGGRSVNEIWFKKNKRCWDRISDFPLLYLKCVRVRQISQIKIGNPMLSTLIFKHFSA